MLCNTAQAVWPHVNLPTQGQYFPRSQRHEGLWLGLFK